MLRTSETQAEAAGECDSGPRDPMPLREPTIVVNRKGLLPTRRERARTIK